ncbi:MAG TPA: Fe-S-binding domain-containing protein [Armatimonadetes bacterium]|nr:Fe-S-binding domain-containing protein [Armatimonadota bacterium]
MTSQELIEQVQARLGEKVLDLAEPVPDQVYVTVASEDIPVAAEHFLRDLRARFLITAGTDSRFKPMGVGVTGPSFVVTHIFSLDEDKLFLSLRTQLDPENPRLPSITPLVTGAAWAERELQDLLGVVVEGHPDPRRLILPDDWPAGVHPLRKDFPYNHHPEPDFSARPQLKEPPEGTVVLPVGPFFPVLEEPSYWRLFVEGETIVGCDYRGFYNHRGIEKLGESRMTYNQVPFLAERICGICGFIHSTCYCEAVERAIGLTPPRRARIIRSIMLELERIHSHLLWLGIAGHIIGFDTVLMQSWRIREPVMWLCEEITGNRKTYGMNLIGGVRWDIPAEKHERVLEVMAGIERETSELLDAMLNDTPLLMRTQEVGPLPEETAREICVVGPTARGSNVPIDARVDHPYAGYDELVPEKQVEEGCDVWARVLVRLGEVLDSVRLVREGIEKLKELPEGDLMTLVEEEIPPGKEGICVVEAPRGEAIHYVLTGENNRLERWRVRAPTYANLQAVPPMIQGGQIADMPISLGSFDPCFSCTERVEVVDVRSRKVQVLTQEDLLRLSRGGRK